MLLLIRYARHAMSSLFKIRSTSDCVVLHSGFQVSGAGRARKLEDSRCIVVIQCIFLVSFVFMRDRYVSIARSSCFLSEGKLLIFLFTVIVSLNSSHVRLSFENHISTTIDKSGQSILFKRRLWKGIHARRWVSD